MSNPEQRHEQQPAKRSEVTAGWWGFAAMGLIALCCAGPVVIASLAAAGALGAVGAWLANPWLWAGAAAIVLGVAWWAWRRRSRQTFSDRG